MWWQDVYVLATAKMRFSVVCKGWERLRETEWDKSYLPRLPIFIPHRSKSITVPNIPTPTLSSSSPLDAHHPPYPHPRYVPTLTVPILSSSSIPDILLWTFRWRRGCSALRCPGCLPTIPGCLRTTWFGTSAWASDSAPRAGGRRFEFLRPRCSSFASRICFPTPHTSSVCSPKIRGPKGISPKFSRVGSSFLVACTRLYNPLCPSVGWSICLSVAEDSEHATYGDWPCLA